MKNNRKKGFSLIELIVVIAVIAAIAAVIVPSIGNFSGTARTVSEERNVQLWISTALQAQAAAPTLTLVPQTATSTLSAISETVSIAGQNVTFSAGAVTLDGRTVAISATGVPTFQ